MPAADAPRRPATPAPHRTDLHWTEISDDVPPAPDTTLQRRALDAVARAIEARLAPALDGGLAPRFDAVVLEKLTRDDRFDRIDVALERRGRGAGRLRAWVRFARGGAPVARVFADGALEFGELNGAASAGEETGAP